METTPNHDLHAVLRHARLAAVPALGRDVCAQQLPAATPARGEDRCPGDHCALRRSHHARCRPRQGSFPGYLRLETTDLLTPLLIGSLQAAEPDTRIRGLFVSPVDPTDQIDSHKEVNR